MSYFVWDQRTDRGQYTEAHLIDPGTILDLPLLQATPMTGRVPQPLRLRLASRSQPADYFHAGPLLILSQRLRLILEGLQVEAEYFRVSLERRGAEVPESDHWFTNLLAKVDCVNLEETDHQSDGGWIELTGKLALQEPKAHGRPLFVLERVAGATMIASHSLRDEVMALNPSGVKFVPVAQWRP